MTYSELRRGTVFVPNLVANYTGALVTAVVQLAVVPFYLDLMGVEAYGLVGYSIMLGALAVLLDLGLTPALSREISRLSGRNDQLHETRALVRTLEHYYVIGVLSVLFVGGMSLLFSNDLLRVSGAISEDTVRLSFGLMAVMIAGQLLCSFYGAGLLGLQRHVLLNTVNVAGLVLRSVGVIPVLILADGGLVLFFVWQSCCLVLHASILRFVLWRELPLGEARIDKKHLARIWRYASGMAGIVALSLLLSQIDKVVLSNLVSLKEFGLYSAATVIASTLSKPTGPIFNTLVPRLTQLVAEGKRSEASRLYETCVQSACVLVFPLALPLIFFSSEVVSIWIGSNSENIRPMASLVAILAVGYACNALVYLSYGLSLAYGWVRFALVQNLIACFFMLPLTVWLCMRFGTVGGAIAWATLNFGFLLVSPYLIHKKLMPENAIGWFKRNIAPAFLAALTVSCVFRGIVQFWLPSEEIVFLYIGLNVFLSVMAGMLVSAKLRPIVFGYAKRYRDFL